MATMTVEPRHLSRLKLTGQDESADTAYHFPLTSPQAFKVPAANGDVILAAEFSRTNWFPGAARVGRPRAQPRGCQQVSLFMFLCEIAARTRAFAAIETLVTATVEKTRPLNPCSVKGYRLWVVLTAADVVAASTFAAQLFSGSDRAPAKRTSSGEHKVLVPGEYHVGYTAFYSEHRYLTAITAYTMGLYHGFAGGVISYDVSVHGASANVGPSGGPDGADDDMSRESFFDAVIPEPNGPESVSQGGHAPALADNHFLAPFEAARLFDAPLTANRHNDSWDLSPEQTSLDGYIHLSGQLKFPSPTNVTVLTGAWFTDAQTLNNRVLPEFYPDAPTVARAISDSVAAIGGDVRARLRGLPMSELLALFAEDAETPFADPTAHAPIPTPAHWHTPKGGRLGQGATALVRVFPTVERCRQHVEALWASSKSREPGTVEREIVRCMADLFETEPDGVPETYYQVHTETVELRTMAMAKTKVGHAIRKALYSPKARARVRRDKGGRMDNGSVMYVQLAGDAVSAMGLTQDQVCPFMLIYPGLGRLGWHTATTSFLVTLEGHVALGKTKLLEVVTDCLPNACVLHQGTMSALADLKSVTCKLSVRDDIQLAEDTGALQSALSTGVRSHSRNELHPSGFGYEVKDHIFVRAIAHLWTSNNPFKVAIKSRAIQIFMAAAKNTGGGAQSLSKMDRAAAPVDKTAASAASVVNQLRMSWCFQFWMQEAVGGLVVDSSIFYATIAVVRELLGDRFTLTTRLLQHVHLCSIAHMVLRITSLWNSVVLPTVTSDDDADPDIERIRFFAHRSIVTAPDVLRATTQISTVADKTRHRFDVVAAIRETIEMQPGGTVPVLSDDELYFVCDLQTSMAEMADRLSGMLESFKGHGIITTFLTDLMGMSEHGHPVMRIAQPRGGGRKRVEILRTHALNPMVVAPRERLIMDALVDYWQREVDHWHSNATGVAHTALAAVEWDEPDNPRIIFRNDVLTSLRKPGENYTFQVADSIVSESPHAMVKTMAFMDFRADWSNTDGMGNYLVADVANVFDPTDLPLVPPTAVPCRADGIVRTVLKAPDASVKCKKEWQHVLAVDWSTLRQYQAARKNTRGQIDTAHRFDPDVTAAVLACEGVVQVGDTVAAGCFQQPDPVDGHPMTCERYAGVADGFSVRVKNPIGFIPAAQATDSDAYDSDTDSEADDDSDDADNPSASPLPRMSTRETGALLFKDGAEHITFDATSQWYNRVEEVHGTRLTGAPCPEKYRRINADYMP